MKLNMPSSSWKKPVHILAFGFGSGASPWAPGTMGTLIAIPLFIPMAHLDLPIYLAVVLVMSLVGIYICGKTAKDLGVHDHGGIVWDEIVGYLITMIAIPLSWTNMLLGFVLFRIFDIWKPWPIKLLDRHVKGGFGIMIDDVLAGLFAWVILYLLQIYVL